MPASAMLQNKVKIIKIIIKQVKVIFQGQTGKAVYIRCKKWCGLDHKLESIRLIKKKKKIQKTKSFDLGIK